MASTKRLGIAVIGAGYWGPNLIRNFHALGDCDLVAVADLNQDRLDAIGRMYNAIDLTNDIDGLFARADVDAVAIATPPATHYSLARQALESGKHVLVEKPLTDSVETAEELIELADNNGLALMVDHTFVYSGPVRKIRDIVSAGDLGDIWYLDSTRIDLGLFNHTNNVVWDLAPHDFSIMNYLLDEKPVSVSAVGSAPVTFTSSDVESLAYVHMELANGATAHFNLSWLSPVKIRRILIGGSKKMLVYDHLELDKQVEVYDKGVDIDSENESRRFLVQRRTGDIYTPKIDQLEPLSAMCQHFIDCATNGRKPDTDGIAGLEVLRLIEAANNSLRDGGKVVSI